MQRLVITTILCIMSQNLLANIDHLKLSSFDLDFFQGRGVFNFESFKYHEDDQTFQIHSISADLTISADKASITNDFLSYEDLNIKSKVFKDAELLKIKDAEFEYNRAKDINFATSLLQAQIGDDVHQISDILLTCNAVQENHHYLAPCMERLEFKTDKIIIGARSRKTFSKAFNVSDQEPTELASIYDIKLKVNNNKMKLKFDIKKYIWLTAKIEALTELDAINNTLSVHVGKAKIGIISIKKILFKTLKEANIKNVTVEGTTIRIAL